MIHDGVFEIAFVLGVEATTSTLEGDITPPQWAILSTARKYYYGH